MNNSLNSFKIILAVLYFVYGEATNPPQWSSTYTVKGVLYVPYGEIVEPFTAWCDDTINASRVDYYDGMVKSFLLFPKGDFNMVNVFPVTTDKELNAIKCKKIHCPQFGVQVQPQIVLPWMDNAYEMIGHEKVNGVMAEKWIKVTRDGKHGELVSKNTVYLRWENSTESPETRIPIPVRYEVEDYNSDYYFFNYEEFTWNSPPPQIFDVGNQTKCEYLPGSIEDHLHIFNPMAEFIHGVTHHVDKAWEHYKQTHDKDYQPDEHDNRKNIFRQNLRMIASHNRANLGYTLAVNHLADRTSGELKVLRGLRRSKGYNGGKPFPYNTAALAKDLPGQFDWRIHGAVTPVKDQSSCGSCWSFGTTGHIEGAYFVKTGQLVRLSEQVLVDCSWGEINQGCGGGEDWTSYNWIQKHGGLPTDVDYGGYLAQNGYCHINQTQMVAPITGWVNVTSNDPDALKIALLKHGPISVGMDAANPSFMFYNSGIYYEKDCSSKILDHSVLLVGYGKIGDRSYWLIKNSWSSYWGNDGYVLIDSKDNNCGIMTAPTYVTM